MINLLDSITEAALDRDLPITFDHISENQYMVNVWNGHSSVGWITIRSHSFDIPRTGIPLEVYTVQSSRLEDNYDDGAYKTLSSDQALNFFVDEIYNLLP